MIKISFTLLLIIKKNLNCLIILIILTILTILIIFIQC